jgi:hypothetical protein
MADVFEVLGADHAQVKDMLVALEESQDYAPAGAPGETVQSARQEVAKLLIMDSSRHEAAEEQYFCRTGTSWPTRRSARSPRPRTCWPGWTSSPATTRSSAR